MSVDQKLIRKALALKPQDKLFLIEALVESLDKPDEHIQDVWLQEAQARLDAHRKGKTHGVPAKDVLGMEP